MEFPITELLGAEQSADWILKHFHPNGLKCPGCLAGVEQARSFRTTKRSGLLVYRCRRCEAIYNLYSGTLFEGRHLTPPQVVLLLRGICKGEPSATLANELGVVRSTVHLIRKEVQSNAERLQPTEPLADICTETDEMFQNAGEKRRGASRLVGPTS